MSVPILEAQSDEQRENATKGNEEAESNSISIEYTNEVYEKKYKNISTSSKQKDKQTRGLFEMQQWVLTAQNPTRAEVTGITKKETGQVHSSTESREFKSSAQYVYEPTKNTFLKKVFTIVVVMVIITICFNLLIFIPVVKEHFKTFGLLYLTIGIIILVTLSYGMLCSVCCRMIQCRKKIIFFVTLGMCLFTSFFTANCSTLAMIGILLAVLIHMLINLWLADENVDFTCLMYIIIMIITTLLSLTLVSVILFVVLKEKLAIYYKVLFYGGILMHGFLIPVQLHMITNGKTIEIGVEEVTYGAYMFYMSFFDTFAKILLIFNLLDEW